MLWRLSELRNKEVINIKEGTRLGFISDVEFDMSTGKVLSVIVPGPSKFSSVFGKRDDYMIPFADIQKTGNDIILVSYEEREVENAPRNRSRFYKE